MKRYLCAMLALGLLLTGAARAGTTFDFDDRTLEELYEAREALDDAIARLERETGARVYESGAYVVGSDLPAGDYVLIENSDAVFASVILRAGSSESDALLAHHLINGQAVIHLNEGSWVSLSEACAVPLEDVQCREDGFADEGGYLVGPMLPAQEYNVYRVDKAPLSSYSIYSDILGTGEQLTKFEVIHDDSTRVPLQEGEYIELSGCWLGPTNAVDDMEE